MKLRLYWPKVNKLKLLCFISFTFFLSVGWMNLASASDDSIGTGSSSGGNVINGKTLESLKASVPDTLFQTYSRQNYLIQKQIYYTKIIEPQLNFSSKFIPKLVQQISKTFIEKNWYFVDTLKPFSNLPFNATQIPFKTDQCIIHLVQEIWVDLTCINKNINSDYERGKLIIHELVMGQLFKTEYSLREDLIAPYSREITSAIFEETTFDGFQFRLSQLELIEGMNNDLIYHYVIKQNTFEQINEISTGNSVSNQKNEFLLITKQGNLFDIKSCQNDSWLSDLDWKIENDKATPTIQTFNIYEHTKKLNKRDCINESHFLLKTNELNKLLNYLNQKVKNDGDNTFATGVISILSSIATFVIAKLCDGTTSGTEALYGIDPVHKPTRPYVYKIAKGSIFSSTLYSIYKIIQFNQLQKSGEDVLLSHGVLNSEKPITAVQNYVQFKENFKNTLLKLESLGIIKNL